VVNLDFFNLTGRQAKSGTLQEIAEFLTIDEVNGRSTIAGRLTLRIGRERARRHQQAFVCPSSHSASKVADCRSSDASFVPLALKEDAEADQVDAQDSDAVDSAIA